MTRIEKAVKEISDLLAFYRQIQRRHEPAPSAGKTCVDAPPTSQRRSAGGSVMNQRGAPTTPP